MEYINKNSLITGFIVGIFFSYALFKTPDCINKQMDTLEKEEVPC
jgi:hypothetical protein|tara:strand:+ start:24 stop:158 length:135 start_codon:yes stop_codon:yes gene_type:complete